MGESTNKSFKELFFSLHGFAVLVGSSSIDL